MPRYKPVNAIVYMLLFGLLIGSSPARAAEGFAYVQDWIIADDTVTSIAAADFTGNGQVDLALARGNTVEILRWDSDHKLIGTVTGLPAPATSLAAGDVDADGLPELLAGTANAGSIQVYGWNGKEFIRKGDTDYLWSAVVSVNVADLDNNFWGDIVAISQRGDGFIFTWNGLKYSAIWREYGRNNQLKNLILADLDGDNIPEILLARRRGNISVWEWQTDGLAKTWENYPWGTVSCSDAADIDGDGQSEILVATTQKMLYVYNWNGSGYPLQYHLSDLAMTYTGMTHSDLNQDGKDEIIVWGDEGIYVQNVNGGKLQTLWDAAFLAEIQNVIALNGRLMILNQKGEVKSFVPVASDYLELLIDGQASEMGDVLWNDGHLMLPLDRLAEQLELDLIFSEAKTSAVVFRGLKGVIVTEGKSKVNSGGKVIAVEAPPVRKDGILYIPPEVLRQLDFTIQFNEPTRSLDIRR